MNGLIDLKQIARLTGMSYTTIRVWRKAGVLPPPMIELPNNRRYWTIEQLEKWRCQLSPVVASPNDRDGSLEP
jgi:DNA-binding transcriptional MerR regulator